jgi:hypothetical protein
MTIEPCDTTNESTTHPERRALLKRIGRFAAVSAPAVTLLLAAETMPRKAAAISAK